MIMNNYIKILYLLFYPLKFFITIYSKVSLKIKYSRLLYKLFAIFILILFIFPLQIFPQLNVASNSEDKNNKTEKKEDASQNSHPGEYKSPMKINMDIEFLRSIFVSPEQLNRVKKSNLFWIDNLKVGFHVRPRFESRQNFDFNKSTDDYSSFTGQNTQIWFIVDPSPHFSFKITIQDARLWGGSQTPGGASPYAQYALTTNAGQVLNPSNANTNSYNIRNSTDLREAFVFLKKNENLPFYIQIGRQIWAYGDLKLIGPLNWQNTGISFDGIRFIRDTKVLNLHAFGSVLSEQHDAPAGLTTNNGRNRGNIDDAYFAGTYNTWKLTDIAWIDFYALGVFKKWIPGKVPTYELSNAQLLTDDRSRQRDNLYTGGIRITNRTNQNTLPIAKRWDWTFESAWQKGVTGEKIDAGWDWIQISYDNKRLYKEKVVYDSRFLSAETGYLILENLRFGLGYTYASGDPNRTDGKTSTWQPLFPQIAGANPYWNIMTGQSILNGFQNVKIYSARINYKTEKFGTFIFATYDTLKAKSQDAWYNAVGVAVDSGSSENKANQRYVYNVDSHLGKRLYYQYDITWIFNYSDFLSIWTGYSHIQAGDSIRNIRDVLEVGRTNFDGTARYLYILFSVAL